MKEKSVTFCFLKLKAKEKANFSKVIGERMTLFVIGDRMTLFVEKLGFFFQS